MLQPFFNLSGPQKENWAKTNRIFNCIAKPDFTRKDLETFELFIGFEPYFIFASLPSLQIVLERFFENNLDVQINSFQELTLGINSFLIDVTCTETQIEDRWAIRLLI
ncbi:MAG: hypothetical protein WC390_06665 [Sulfurimonas sp.]|jgi:hypothetical protein